jgi:hypothetical protein
MNILNQNTWEFINSFAGWFSALGTIAAVVVALYFSRRDKTIRLEVFAGYRWLVTLAHGRNNQQFLCVGIVNIGHREVQITGLGWKVGFFKKVCADQPIINDGISSSVPIRLRDGDEARYYFPFQDQDPWLDDFVNVVLGPNPNKVIRTLKIRVYTSVGKIFENKIEKGLQKRLVEFIEKNGERDQTK